jgi:nucleotide-binding universal stress UspA family protein
VYQHILIPLENSPTDRTILAHVRDLATLTGARLLLLHVADGWVARNYNQLELQESEEMREDQKYLSETALKLRDRGFDTQFMLAMGDPATEIIRVAKEQNVDLLAMGTHGHGMIGDILYGSTADKVRHAVSVPVLLLKEKKA